MRLERRHALASGGASGIGAATARRLAAEGARVTRADLNLDGARAVAGEIGRRLKEGMVAATALRRIGMPDEVAAAIAFLAGDDASYVTGQTLNVSGGLSM